MAKKARKRRPAPDKQKFADSTRIGFGIKSPHGNMWTSEIFNTPAEAEQHLANWWRGIDRDLSKFKIVRARQSVKYLGDLQ
jgi:hypothetical protein